MFKYFQNTPQQPNTMNQLNKEKQQIIKTKGNILVTANPGTGKTKLLAHKYLALIEEGIKPEDILCLTFTRKAKKEMEERISKLIESKNITPDKLNIHTFHSYALENLEQDDIISPNLLRYSIYTYIKNNDLLNYGDSYLLDTIVPKMENLIRYVKNFKILPKNINLKALNLEDFKKYSKEELEKFANDFVNIFIHYEKVKEKLGSDYTDLLIKFINKQKKQFKYVLVDELQDVNTLEADIALNSADHFIAVGDKKQSIFGFQGGSIINFKKFNNSTKFILSENFRSTNSILNYSKTHFINNTKDKEYEQELKDLKNNTKEEGVKPKIYEVEREFIFPSVCALVEHYLKEKKKVAVIARANSQILQISKELTTRDIEHSSTFFSASSNAKKEIITYINGVFSNNIEDVKNAMFTPYFSLPLEKAFELSAKKELSLEDIYKTSPEFKNIRSNIKSTEDIDNLFLERIMPVAVTRGREILMAASTLQRACSEAIQFTEKKSLEDFIAYLESSDLLSDEANIDKDVTLTTVHKAKGKEFDIVIYVPTKTRDTSNFQDAVVKAMLKEKSIDAEEELEEESLRIDFVAFTRAVNELHIITDKAKDYMNEFAEEGEIEAQLIEGVTFSERMNRAYVLFTNKQYEEAKKLLETNNKWIKEYIINHFNNIKTVSFTSLEAKPYDYLCKKILNLKTISKAMQTGSKVHALAESLSRGESPSYEEEYVPYVDNIKSILNQIKKEYPNVFLTEGEFLFPISEISDLKTDLLFRGFIDAVFTNGEKYLIIDWKSDKTEENASKHRQQLESYKRALSYTKKIPIENIDVAIGFIGLRGNINMGEIKSSFDNKQPAKSSFYTFAGRVINLQSWIDNPENFLQNLKEENVGTPLWNAVVEQWKMEIK